MRSRTIPLELTEDEIEIHSAACVLANSLLKNPDAIEQISESMDNTDLTYFLRAAMLLAEKNDEYMKYLEKVMIICNNTQTMDGC